MRRRLTVAGACLLLAGCSALQSEAYQAGYSVGEELRNLGDWSEVLDSWNPESDGTGSIKPDDYREYCDGMWSVAGFASGLKNTDENRSDFVDGCVDGAKG